MAFATVAYAQAASYSFKGVTATHSANTNTFTLDKGTVAITGTQAVDSKWIASELPKFAKNTVKYELYNASTGKLCGSALIPICTPLAKKVSFSNVKLGTAPASGKYFIKVSTTVKSVTVSGSGTVKSFDIVIS